MDLANKDRDRYFKRIRKQVKTWLELEARDQAFEKRRLQLEEQLKVNEDSVVFQGIATLQTLASYYRGLASCRIFEEANVAGASEFIARSLAYDIRSMRIDVANHQRRVEAYNYYMGDANDLYHLLLFLILFNQDRENEWLFGFVEKLKANDVFKERCSLDMPYVSFVDNVLAFYRTGVWPVINSCNTSYSQIISNWDHDGPFADAIIEILDYHLISAVRGKGYSKEHETCFPDYAFNAAFDREDVMLWPLEVLVLYKLRIMHGKSWPPIEHLLLPAHLFEVLELEIDASWTDKLLSRVDELLSMRAEQGKRAQ